MSELQDMLRVQARLHRKQGANALGDLFQSAALEIEILTERLENPQGLQELICVEQMKEISLPEIHRANQKLHEQLAKANERIANREAFVNELQVIQSCRDRELERLDKKLAKANERVKELEFSLGRLRAEILHACVEGSSSSGGIKKSAAHNLHNQALMIPPYAEQLRKEQEHV